jgi:hypothetical protein
MKRRKSQITKLHIVFFHLNPIIKKKKVGKFALLLPIKLLSLINNITMKLVEQQQAFSIIFICCCSTQ